MIRFHDNFDLEVRSWDTLEILYKVSILDLGISRIYKQVTIQDCIVLRGEKSIIVIRFGEEGYKILGELSYEELTYCGYLMNIVDFS